MKRSFGLVGVAILAMAGCSQNESVGFTGIGSETKSAADPWAYSLSPGATAPRGYATGVVKQSVPVSTVKSGSKAPAAQAEVAMRKAGTKDRNSAPVKVSGQDLRLSVVKVNGQPYAVLKSPGMIKGAMSAETSEVFQRNAGRLTGCVGDGSVYSNSGSGNRATAMALALNCL